MVSIRQIEKEDAPAFREMLDSVCRERNHLAQLVAPSIERAQAFVDANVDAGHPQFVAEVAGKLVGWCDLIRGNASSTSPHVGRLGMGVLKEYRRQRIGRRLIETTIKQAVSMGIEKIELNVRASNEPAIALYQSIGFQEEGRKNKGWLVDGIYDDIILMALALKQPNQKPEPAAVAHRDVDKTYEIDEAQPRLVSRPD